MNEDRDIAAKLKNEIIDLKNHIKKQNKKMVSIMAENSHLRDAMQQLLEHQKASLLSFEKKHRGCIDSIIEMVEKPNFVTLPAPQRVKAVKVEYGKIILG